IFRNPDLAWSYKEIASHGRKAFYEGAIAKRILGYSASLGGTMNADDLANFSCAWVEPVSTTYRGWTVYELPPNCQGIAALEMLNLMETFPLAEHPAGSAAALHLMSEAKTLAYADIIRYACDPKFNKIPIAGIVSKPYARERAKLIDPAKANCHVEAG